MSQVPQRRSLPDQVVQILRDGIATARWTNELPSEAVLCRDLQVSRVTLRKALEQLIHERWLVAGGRGHHHQIRWRATGGTVSRATVVRVLSSHALADLDTLHHAILDHLRVSISGFGYRIEFEHRPQLYTRFDPEKLGHLDSQPDTAAWILLYSTDSMQRWFADNNRPCVVLGPLHDTFPLSNIYPDTEAIGRHAAGLFCARGHRTMAYLLAESTSLGDRRASRAFADTAVQAGAQVHIVTHDRSSATVREALDSILSLRSPPTAFMSSCPEHCLTILCHLQNSGHRVPDDYAILCGWSDMSLYHTVPLMSHYRVEGAKAGRNLAKLVVEQLTHGAGKIRKIALMPGLIIGGTLGREPGEA